MFGRDSTDWQLLEKVEWIQSHCLQAWEQGSRGTRHDWKQGLGSGHFGFKLACGSHCCSRVSDRCVYWCFNWPRPCTWADENHMFQCDSVCGLVKTELWLKSCPWLAQPHREPLCMLKTFFFPLSWLMQRSTTSTWSVFSLTKGFGSWFILQDCCWNEYRGVGALFF